MSRVSLQNIAIRLKVSKQTVSRALRGERYVKPDLAQKIRQAAREMGYQPDARFRLLTRIRQGTQRSESIALIFPKVSIENAGKDFYTRGIITGAKQRAEESGFHLEVHSLIDQPGSNRLERTMRARGTELLIIGPLSTSVQGHISLHWERYATALIGPSIWSPLLNRVLQNHYFNIVVTFRHLRKLGYRRPALVMGRVLLKRSIHVMEASFRQNADLIGLKNPARYIWKGNPEENPGPFKAWLEKMKVDVVISDHQFNTFFTGLGLSIPEEMGFVSIVSPASLPRISGIKVRTDLLGANAVDLLAGHYYRNERGIPKNPKIVLHEDEWNEGATLRRIKGQ